MWSIRTFWSFSVTFGGSYSRAFTVDMYIQVGALVSVLLMCKLILKFGELKKSRPRSSNFLPRVTSCHWDEAKQTQSHTPTLMYPVLLFSRIVYNILWVIIAQTIHKHCTDGQMTSQLHCLWCMQSPNFSSRCFCSKVNSTTNEKKFRDQTSQTSRWCTSRR